MSVSVENPQLVPLSRLPPAEVIVPKQSWSAGRLAFATSVFSSRMVPPLFEIPAPARPDEFAMMVTLVRVAEPSRLWRPPPRGASVVAAERRIRQLHGPAVPDRAASAVACLWHRA